MGTDKLNLLDMLDEAPAWLGCMVLAIDPRHPDLLALFRSCSKLQQLVLQQRSLRPKLNCLAHYAGKFGTPTRLRALAMAEASHNNVHLHIQIGPLTNSHQMKFKCSIVAAFSKAACMYSQNTGQHPPAPGQLQCITTICLNAAKLGSLIPDFLVQGCPNLKELSLHYVNITESAPKHQPICTSLQKLKMSSVQIKPALKPQVALQLLNLPSLTHLHMDSSGRQCDFKVDGIFRAAIDKYSSQLLSLHLLQDSLPGTVMPHGLLPWSPGNLFPHLRLLNLYNWSVTCDKDMQQLLDAAPNATSVRLDSIRGLGTSFAQEPSWQELTLRMMYVDQLALLPLSSCTRLMCHCALHLRDLDGPVPSPEQITAGVAAAQAAGGLHVSHQIGIILYSDDVQRIPAAAPLLQHLKAAEVHVVMRQEEAAWSDWLPLLTVLGQHLECEGLELNTVKHDGLPNAEELNDLARQLMPHVKRAQFNVFPAVQ